MSELIGRFVDEIKQKQHEEKASQEQKRREERGVQSRKVVATTLSILKIRDANEAREVMSEGRVTPFVMLENGHNVSIELNEDRMADPIFRINVRPDGEENVYRYASFRPPNRKDRIESIGYTCVMQDEISHEELLERDKDLLSIVEEVRRETA